MSSEASRASLSVGGGPGRGPGGVPPSGEPVSARSTSLRALAARLMGETHHTPVLENWGLLWIYHSIALLVFFGATNWLYLAG